MLLNSVTIRTESCTKCPLKTEGVFLSLRGKHDGTYPDGYPCNSARLNHPEIADFNSAKAAKFGVHDQDMMGNCFKVSNEFQFHFVKALKFEAPLNGEVTGGEVTWDGGDGDWTPLSVCVDWLSSDFAYECDVQKSSLVNCKSTGRVEC